MAVSRGGRLLDLVGLLLFIAGGGLYARAWSGFRSVPDFQPSIDGPAWAAVQLADGFRRLQRIGTGLMLMGMAVFVLAWWVVRSEARRASLPSPPSTP